MSRFEERLKLLTPAPASDALRERLARPALRRRIWTRTVPMAAAAAGLIAAVTFALVQAPTGTPSARNDAEKELRRIEETLRGAPSLRVSTTRVAEPRSPKPQKVRSQTVLMLKKGSRLNLTTTETSAAGEVTFVYLCDGNAGAHQVKSPQGLKNPQALAVRPDDLNEKIVLALARDTVAVASTLLRLDLDKLRGHLEATDVVFRTDDEGRKILAYRMKGFDVKLWYDPIRFLPLRRVLTREEAGTFTETYEGWELGAELADDLFRLPK